MIRTYTAHTRTVITLDAAVARIRFEFAEMPDLKLTLPQLSRLCNLPEDVCARALDLLVETGALRKSSNGCVGPSSDLTSLVRAPLGDAPRT